MKLQIFNEDFHDGLTSHYRMIFADPPDNVGLKYDECNDKMSASEYKCLLIDTFNLVDFCDILWVSFNSKYMSLVGSILYESFENFDVRWFSQNVSFGYYLQKDFGKALRPLVRVMWKGAITYPDSVRVESVRQKMGDKRANSKGKIPTDVWDINRVQGNNKQRRKWHPTQLNEELYKRCLLFSTQPGDRVADPFAGTGTMARAAKDMDLEVDLFDISRTYCQNIAKEFGVEVL